MNTQKLSAIEFAAMLNNCVDEPPNIGELHHLAVANDLAFIIAWAKLLKGKSEPFFFALGSANTQSFDIGKTYNFLIQTVT